MSKIKFIFFLASLLFIFACSHREVKEPATRKKQLVFSAPVSEILSDTAAFNPVVDSLKREVKTAGDTAQVLLLNELSENWAPYASSLAAEAILQSKKLSFPFGEADAYCRMGIYYYRRSNFDSANYFLEKAHNMALGDGWDKIIAEAISIKAEVLRQQGNFEKVIELQDKAIKISEGIRDKKRLAYCLISKAEAYRIKGLFDKAFDCYYKCIAYAKEINDVNKIIICNNSMGDIYRVKGDNVKALEFFNTALALARKNVNKLQIAFCLNSIGDIYQSQKDYDKALQNYKEGIKVAEETGSKYRVSKMYSSMGTAYQALKNRDMAFECFDRAYKMAEEIGYQDNMAFSLENIANIYQEAADYKTALDYFQRAYRIAEETGNAGQLSDFAYGIGECYMAMHDVGKAQDYIKQALEIGQETGIKNNIKNASHLLYLINQQQGRYKEALEWQNLHMQMRDSLNNEEAIKQFAAVEFKAREDKLKSEQKAKEEMFKAEQARKEEELKRQKTIRYAFTIGFALVLILAIVIYRGLRVNKKQNKIIMAQKKEVEHQKELVEEKNKEITDSITYAKRLQEAILPPVKMVKQFFPESFVLYKPKDIIAGDFYWMEKIGDTIFFAAADSTGHGVPGAMVSVVCSNALNRAVKEFGLKETGKILDKTRELVIETFEKSEGEVKDGMDISLLAIHRTPNLPAGQAGSQLPTLQWSGANNPLWYISDGKIEEVKATKQPIGKSDNPQPFATHNISYAPGSVFYLFTDGFADQFGGPKGKKFKYKQMEELISTNAAKPLGDQEKILDEAFVQWKAGYEQVDDVTVIGIKI